MIPYGHISRESGEDYHAQPGTVISKSRLDIFIESPAIFNGRFLAKTIERPETTAAQLEGFAAHTLILEPEKFSDQFAVLTEWPDFRTKAAQEWRDSNLAAGRSVLKKDQVQMLHRVKMEMAMDPDVQALLGGECETEVTFRRKGALFDIQCRPDRLNLKDVTLPSTGDTFRRPIVDLKLTDSLEQFDKNFGPFGYHRQDVWYKQVVRQVEADAAGIKLSRFPDFPTHDFVFIVMEKNEPFRIAIRQADDLAIETAEREIETALARAYRCFESGRWPKEWKPRRVERVALPPWYQGQVASEAEQAVEVSA